MRFGDTVVLATAVFAKEPKENADFFPLTVDYRENTYAAGRIPGGWFKREGRPTEKEILTSRLIDRPLRPLFPKGFTHETQIIAFVLSADGQNDSDILAINGASVALDLLARPVRPPDRRGARGYGRRPVRAQPDQRRSARSPTSTSSSPAPRTRSSWSRRAPARSPRQTMLDAILFGHEAIRRIVAAQKELQRRGRLAKAGLAGAASLPGRGLRGGPPAVGGADAGGPDPARRRSRRTRRSRRSRRRRSRSFPRRRPSGASRRRKAVDDLVKVLTRETILNRGKRLDGRALRPDPADHLRGRLLPRTHGSALFTRGETQALVTATLGTSDDVQIIEELEGETEQRFLLHYNFPPFSVGEVKFMRGPSRRDIGHGNLARRALSPGPAERGRVPLHDARRLGHPRVQRLLVDGDGLRRDARADGRRRADQGAGRRRRDGPRRDGDRFAILTDIAGQEDHYGDMDFKVAGTRDGITALQMDIKIQGLSREVLEQALEQARDGAAAHPRQDGHGARRPRPNISPYAPRIFTMQIPSDKIRDVIGPGGKTIRSIIEETGCKIDVEDDGKVIDRLLRRGRGAAGDPDHRGAHRRSPRSARSTRARCVASSRTAPSSRSCRARTAWCTSRSSRPTACAQTTDVVKEGDEVTVKVIAVDPMGKIKLSRKQALSKEALEAEMAMAPVGGDDEEGRRREGEHSGPPNRDRGPRGPRR